jgi:hypothetical protein
MERKAETLQTLPKVSQEAFRLMAILEPKDESSSAGEFHPHALTEPDVNLSAHPALIVQPKRVLLDPRIPPKIG